MDMEMDGMQDGGMIMYFNTNLPVTVAFSGWEIKDIGGRWCSTLSYDPRLKYVSSYTRQG